MFIDLISILIIFGLNNIVKIQIDFHLLFWLLCITQHSRFTNENYGNIYAVVQLLQTKYFLFENVKYRFNLKWIRICEKRYQDLILVIINLPKWLLSPFIAGKYTGVVSIQSVMFSQLLDHKMIAFGPFSLKVATF